MTTIHPLVVPASEEHFGVCPFCEQSDGYINVGRGHWFYCTEHKAKWLVGENIFDSWKHETEEEQRARYNELGFGDFEQVESVHPYACEHCSTRIIVHRPGGDDENYLCDRCKSASSLRGPRMLAVRHELVFELTKLAIDRYERSAANEDMAEVAAAGIDALTGTNWGDELIWEAHGLAPHILDRVQSTLPEDLPVHECTPSCAPRD